MTGARGGSKSCPLCGGELREGLATIPLVMGQRVLVIRDAPAEVCLDCGEPFLTGVATDTIQGLVERLQAVNAEVSVVSYPRPLKQPA
jgi:YgiT-type zinc finger domain-containing protein